MCVCVSVCVYIKYQYQHQSVVHLSSSSPYHNSHLIPRAAFHFLCLGFFLHGSWYLLGTPETSLRGLSTLNALRALTSKPAAFPPIGVAPSPFVACSKIALNNLQDKLFFYYITVVCFFTTKLCKYIITTAQ